jgi:hypothetical protein
VLATLLVGAALLIRCCPDNIEQVASGFTAIPITLSQQT